MYPAVQTGDEDDSFDVVDTKKQKIQKQWAQISMNIATCTSGSDTHHP